MNKQFKKIFINISMILGCLVLAWITLVLIFKLILPLFLLNEVTLNLVSFVIDFLHSCLGAAFICHQIYSGVGEDNSNLALSVIFISFIIMGIYFWLIKKYVRY